MANVISFSLKNARVVEAADFKQSSLYAYFLQNAEARIACADEDKRVITENMRDRLHSLPAVPTSALNAYLNRSNVARQPPEHLIYPFGLNLSQIQAVEQAFSSQISIIEGPPGTGKTQTILNIIANVLLQNKRVAIAEKVSPVGIGIAVEKLKTTLELQYAKARFLAEINNWKQKQAIWIAGCRLSLLKRIGW
ncbi:AAA domain-containing protein [Candidatus Pantoea persica]|uniref:AAA domain-containing protein n=1 Tax=Candidatus Pantoea persica TaxID=2518128 RepID=UPI00215D66FF|nr:AAA domain-containing protein [Candidatus Pantoea persica]MBA2814667.1 helicase [Candidatus Pantoea persica]